MVDALPLETPKRIAVVRALVGLGDMLCAIPALRALRAALPDAEITLIGLPQGREVAKRFPQYVDRMMELPGWPGLPETPPNARKVPAFLAAVVAERFDLALQMHGSGEITNQLTALLGAPVTAGYYLPGQWCPDVNRYLPWTGRQPEPRRWLGLISHLGMPLKGEYLEFPVFEHDRAAFGQLSSAFGLIPGRYVCVHPGAGAHSRRWPPERFARVADWLAEQGHTVVVTGAEGERQITAAVVQSMRSKAIDLTGQTDLGTLGALLESSRLLVCNDTGVSHAAAALDVPSVVIFSDSDPERWAPANRRLHRIVLQGRLGQRAGTRDAEESVRAEAAGLLTRGRLPARVPALFASGRSWS